MKKKFRKITALCLCLILLLPFALEVYAMIEDMDESHWCYDDVLFGYQCGLFEGTSDSSFRFEPNRTITRAEFITMLGKLYELPEDQAITYQTPAPFSDVTEDAYYFAYVSWAAENNLISGFPDGLFHPNDRLTREQMAVFLYKFMETYGLWVYFEEFAFTEPLDLTVISLWALYPVNKLRSYKIMSGYGDGYFSPKDLVTRAQAAASLVKITKAVYPDIGDTM